MLVAREMERDEQTQELFRKLNQQVSDRINKKSRMRKKVSWMVLRFLAHIVKWYIICTAAVTNYHKLNGLKQHKSIILQFYRSVVSLG